MARAGVYGARSDAGALDLTISSSTTAICMPKKQRIFFFVRSQKHKFRILDHEDFKWYPKG